MIARTLAILVSLTLAAAGIACSDSNAAGSSGGAFKCQTSSAKSGTLCQLNFNCPSSADSRAAYCSEDGTCSCGAASTNPKTFTSAGICAKSLDEMATIANQKCGFGM
jgi:hypothetical protein